MRRFQEVWTAVDIDGIVAPPAADSLLTMPPKAARFVGREAIGGFFATAPMEGRLDLIRLVPTRLNGQPPSPPTPKTRSTACIAPTA